MDHQFGNGRSTSRRLSRDLAYTLLALVLGLVIGLLDLHVTEVAVTILALLAAGLLLGLLQPAGAWRWALLIAAGLPIMAAVALAVDMKTAEPAGIDFRIAAVALTFALAGSYAGVAIRHAARAATGRRRQNDGEQET